MSDPKKKKTPLLVETTDAVEVSGEDGTPGIVRVDPVNRDKKTFTDSRGNVVEKSHNNDSSTSPQDDKLNEGHQILND